MKRPPRISVIHHCVRIFHIFPGDTAIISDLFHQCISSSLERSAGTKSIRSQARATMSTERDWSNQVDSIGVIILRTGINLSGERIPIWVEFPTNRFTQMRDIISIPTGVNSPIFLILALSIIETIWESSWIILPAKVVMISSVKV